MKKTITAVLSLALFTCLIIFSCRKEGQEKAIIGEQKAAMKMSAISSKSSESDAGAKLGWSPEGSKITTFEGGISVVAPKEWGYLGIDKQNNLVKFESYATKTITCTCNTNGTCKPFSSKSLFGSTQGCAGTCSNCTMQQSVGGGRGPIEIETGGYYMPDAKIRIMQNGESAPAVFGALLRLEEFQKQFTDFIKLAYNGKREQKPVYLEDGSITAPKGHSLVAISIMGRGMGVILPDEFVLSRLGSLSSSKASCSCNVSGSCTLKSKDIGIASSYWCEGDCSSCSLTTSRFSLPDLGLKVGVYNVTLRSFAL